MRIYSSIYHATLCLSAVFAVCLSVCLSVHLSVRHVHVLYYCITDFKMDEDILNLRSRPGSPIILVFDQSAGTQFQGEILQRGHKIHVVSEN